MITVLPTEPCMVPKPDLAGVGCQVVMSEEGSPVSEPWVITERHSITVHRRVISHHCAVNAILHRIAIQVPITRVT